MSPYYTPMSSKRAFRRGQAQQLKLNIMASTTTTTALDEQGAAASEASSATDMAAVSNPMLAVEWYVMRVTYQRELVAQRLLGQLGIESFVPTQKVRRKVGGRYLWREEAKVHNYIFVRSSQVELQQIKETRITYLRFMMAKNEEGNKWVPQFVRADQMEHFMAICRSEGVKYLDPEVDLRKGDRVKVIRGGLAGVEGTFIKISAKNEKRVVVRIEGVAAVATAAIPAADVERMDKDS